MIKKNIGIIGSTGSIGTQTVDVILRNRDLFNVVFISCYSNVKLLEQQINLLEPTFAVVTSGDVKEKQIGKTKIFCSMEDLTKIIENEKLTMVVASTVGFSGLTPTYSAIEKGIDVALANKESIVTGGEVLISLAKKSGSRIIPVDSEHSAIYQCLIGQKKEYLNSITLTASGGPFRKRPDDSLIYASVEETLRHPNWSMGAKITVDSATMMNKGLEIIEAKYLFDVETEMLKVLIHPESIVHSFVSFMDGSSIAQMGLPDMRTAISFALGFPERIDSGVAPLDLSKAAKLTFYEPDAKKYKCLSLAIDILKTGSNILLTAMNAANEIAVELFLKKCIKFTDIPELVEKTVFEFSQGMILSIDEILKTDILAREKTYKIYNNDY